MGKQRHYLLIAEAKFFVNNASTSGGKTLEAQRLTMTGSTTNSTNGAVVKAMNGVNGTRSYIKLMDWLILMLIQLMVSACPRQ